MNYQEYVLRLLDAMGARQQDIELSIMIPAAIESAEERIYRELNLLSTTVRSTAGALSPDNRFFTLPTDQGTFTSVTEINVLTPVGTIPALATRTPLSRCTLKFLNFLAPTDVASSPSAVPSLYAMITDQQIAVGPAPGNAFPVEVVGYAQPAALSPSNDETWISQNLPDLFLAASMVYLLGNNSNVSQPGGPSLLPSWEATYQTLLRSALDEEARRRYNLYVNTPRPVVTT